MTAAHEPVRIKAVWTPRRVRAREDARFSSWLRATLTGIALVVPMLAAALPAAAQIYTLVDASGRIHLTNTPCLPEYVALVPPEVCAPSTPPAPPSTTASPLTDLPTVIARLATGHGVDPRLVEAVVRVESGGNPRAVSPKGARGLMQLMPARAAALGVGDMFDPIANLVGGIQHLRELLLRYQGDVALALAAYNAGEGAVEAYGGIPPYRETQEYVRKVLALYRAITPVNARGSLPQGRSLR